MTQWLGGLQDPGLMILEHELSDQSVASFMAAYPLMKSKGWKIGSAARLINSNGAYRNAAGPTGSATAAGLLDFKGQGPTSAFVVGQTGTGTTRLSIAMLMTKSIQLFLSNERESAIPTTRNLTPQRLLGPLISPPI
ncbi:hypothetical protein C8J56DRAFT_1058775 [Mycena floridula]|nr:hypothetical protein C8J56DRAFT_1058775 [Mycena floridula]